LEGRIPIVQVKSEGKYVAGSTNERKPKTSANE
jgi:hypothetical protein